VAQRIAGHADSRTTKLYDRRGQKVLLEDMERIGTDNDYKSDFTHVPPLSHQGPEMPVSSRLKQT
jgi:hypothetical protein